MKKATADNFKEDFMTQAVNGPTVTLARVTQVDTLLAQFKSKFTTEEAAAGVKTLIYEDMRSKSQYIIVHLPANIVAKISDLEAVLTPEDGEEYKLNRDIYRDNYAYQVMKEDACKGRRFEDIVVEFDPSYRPDKPLKVFGGQHRVTAITEAFKSGQNQSHGLRIYFGLNEEQRLDVAKANNTAIAVANDLLDRMQEDFLGNELRTWCQSVGFLENAQNFADKRSAAGIPTVRIARTFITNFQMSKGRNIDELQDPIVCQSGPQLDATYESVRTKIDWLDSAMLEAGKQFVSLHKLQRQRVSGREKDSYSEYANKALHPCIVAAWAYAAGLFQGHSAELEKHFNIPLSVKNQVDADPLGAADLSKARLKGSDPDNYRGLGAPIWRRRARANA